MPPGGSEAIARSIEACLDAGFSDFSQIDADPDLAWLASRA